MIITIRIVVWVGGKVEYVLHPIYLLLMKYGLNYDDLLPGHRQVWLDAFMGWITTHARFEFEEGPQAGEGYRETLDKY